MAVWKLWIDTGGTFTDCIGVSPNGNFRRTKVLSNSALRGQVEKVLSPGKLKVKQQWDAPSGFASGFDFTILGRQEGPVKVTAFDAKTSTLRLEEDVILPEDDGMLTFEIRSSEEAPILAARLLTGTLPSEPLPALEMRLATTKGTNALLERTGAPTTLFITEGFGDLLRIGNQKRPDLFAMEVNKEPPLFNNVIEVPERLDAEGEVVRAIDFDVLEERLRKLPENPKGDLAAAVCLMHAYKNTAHERELENRLREKGINFISSSGDLSPLIKILPRAQTTVVNAYLEPVLRDYLSSVKKCVGDGSLHIMTSAGGLAHASAFTPKDSLLSGPAGGVVGASVIGRESGCQDIISFDMGGTSTDVARYSGGFDYVFEHRVGSATLNAPALSIETVAAGGGSVCSFDGQKLKVGPESAGASPGPACYGAGGPLTVTDVNLLLGRLEAQNFGIPISAEASEQRLEKLLDKIASLQGSRPDRKEILEGFLQIANERMSDAIRTISMRKGYDPAGHTLVTFGGAGAQHACSIASELGMDTILIPADAGLLSAYGLGNAVVEEFSERQLLTKLNEISSFEKIVKEIEQMAIQKLKDRQQFEGSHRIRRRLVYLRLHGQDSTIEVEYDNQTDILEAFRQAYIQRYGHWIEGREIEVESVRVVASSGNEIPNPGETVKSSGKAEAGHTTKVQFNLKRIETPVYDRKNLQPGNTLSGPALILDPYSTTVVEPGWQAQVEPNGTLRLVNNSPKKSKTSVGNESIALELFTNRFTAIAEEMGEMLRRTALSVNVKERMDFSCALLSAEGELVVNAPHIPVHLGALGLCVRRLKESIEMKPGDVVVTNHPAFGGSHLPDITVVTPIFDTENQLLGYAASRAHHAEIGGKRPGSMPPDARRLSEEGIVIPPMYLVENGEERWDDIREHLTNARWPSRNVEENIADLQAAVAANHRGAVSLRELARREGTSQLLHYMQEIKKQASDKAENMLRSLDDGSYQSEERLDDGSLLKVTIQKDGGHVTFDFNGTAEVHPGNLNATPAIVNSVVMYVLRLLIGEALPLNEGLLKPVGIKLPHSMLSPEFPDDPEQCPAVVGGNTETSQRLVDLILKPFGKIACSQGTMNNVLFGNERFGYYETVGGGTGAGPDFNGADAVHHHMTNTAGTDPEILEHRYPVRLDRYAIRKGSGGQGKHKGGDGIVREMTFLETVSLSVLTQHRTEAPYGLQGGEAGSKGMQKVIRNNGETEDLNSVDGRELDAGDRFILHTPGGGGFGSE